MEVIGIAANVIAVVDLSVKVGSLCLQYAKDVNNASADINRLREEVASLQKVTEQVQSLLDKPNGERLRNSHQLDAVLKQSYFHLDELDQRLESKPPRKLFGKLKLRTLKWPLQRGEVEVLVQSLRRYNETISWNLQVHQTEILHEVDGNMRIADQRAVLSTLPVADGASFDSGDEQNNAVCLPNTRVDVMQQIRQWADSPSTETLFWLNGMAGTGKSTISRTICNQFAESGQLAASFFFKRGEADRGNLTRFVTTIAAQIAQMHPDVAPHIKSAIDDDSQIFRRTTLMQFNKLVKEPLNKAFLSSQTRLSLVFVIDALDECDQDESVKLIIDLFSSCAKEKSQKLRLKCLITSRPELPIHFGFDSVKGTFQGLLLHQVPDVVIEQDIAAFLKYELNRIKIKYNKSMPISQQLPPNWPGQQNIQILVKRAVPLFIVAATTCRFINDHRCGNPDMQLRQLLNFQPGAQASPLDSTYLPVLNSLASNLSTSQQKVVVERFRSIVGSIVILANPLPKSALSELLNLPAQTIDHQLSLLHSVLSIPPVELAHLPVRPLHLSFREFLVDPNNRHANLFWIDEEKAHQMMWLEALSLLGRAPESLKILRSVISALSEQGSGVIGGILQGALQLVQANLSVMVATPLQIYCSVAAFIPTDSPVRKLFQAHMPDWISPPELDDHWDQCQYVLGGHKGEVTAVCFSPDGKLVASGSTDHTVRLWDRSNGNCIRELKGHEHWVNSVSFFPSGSLVASISDDQRFRLWRSNDGTCVRELKEPGHPVASMTFSTDATFTASVSDDYTVWLWRSDDGMSLKKLKGHKASVPSLAFSSNEELLASASYDHTVRLWVTSNGTCVRELIGHKNSVTSVVFSPNGRLIASGSVDRTVRLWSTADGTFVRELKGHEERINAVAFSPNGMLIASASDDHTARLWRADDGICMQRLDGHDSWVTSVNFSPDGKLVATASNDQTIRLWRTDYAATAESPQVHQRQVNFIAFSPDGRLVASASGDDVIRLWSSTSGCCVREFLDTKASLLEFDKSGLCLFTGRQTITLPPVAPSSQGAVEPSPGHLDISLSPDNSWILWKSIPVFWVPSPFRSQSSKVRDSTVALASRSGKVVIVKFGNLEFLE
ncbi:uncharacterized protein BROUX77_000328 [Berkeleyomyces rouxiae]|uniref:uncharacterized protein n=2 Tax=Berkeleyomyces rouxiae TaxID=2035830 RepID=UPI003B75F4E3